jgi:hypothetical protein
VQAAAFDKPYYPISLRLLRVVSVLVEKYYRQKKHQSSIKKFSFGSSDSRIAIIPLKTVSLNAWKGMPAPSYIILH